MLYGYINKKTELKDKAFHAKTYGFLTSVRHYRKFEELGFTYQENIALEYNRRKLEDMSDTRMMGPKELKGMSGSGIWLSVAGRQSGTFRYLRVGIMIEERLERGFTIGTKLDPILDHLNK